MISVILVIHVNTCYMCFSAIVTVGITKYVFALFFEMRVKGILI